MLRGRDRHAGTRRRRGRDRASCCPTGTTRGSTQSGSACTSCGCTCSRPTAGQLAEQGHYGLALESALAALRADDLRESAHRAVISIHLAEGNVVEARRAYDLCRRTFVEELGIEPSSAIAGMLTRETPSHSRGTLHSVTRSTP